MEPGLNPDLNPNALIRASHLAVRLEGKTILQDVSLRVEAGGMLAIIGPNGAGKTTLLKTLLGLIRPTGGEIRLMGRPLSAYSVRERAQWMAYVPQQTELPGALTVREFIRLGRYPYRSPLQPLTTADCCAMDAALAMTGAGPLAERRLDTLSGGEQRRVLIAGALAQEPRVLFLDEPTAFLDPAHQAGLWRLLEGVRRETGMALVFVTHDFREAMQVDADVLALKAGLALHSGHSSTLADAMLLERLFDMRFRLLVDPVGGLPIVIPDSLEPVGDDSPNPEEAPVIREDLYPFRIEA